MTAVVDANLAVALHPAHARNVAARYRIDQWIANGEDLHAPHLFEYEVADAIVQHRIVDKEARWLWEAIEDLGIWFHPPSHAASLVEIALRMHRQTAYDAAYIDLALALGAELWTLDGKLARNAESIGFPVRLVV